MIPLALQCIAGGRAFDLRSQGFPQRNHIPKTKAAVSAMMPRMPRVIHQEGFPDQMLVSGNMYSPHTGH